MNATRAKISLKWFQSISSTWITLKLYHSIKLIIYNTDSCSVVFAVHSVSDAGDATVYEEVTILWYIYLTFLQLHNSICNHVNSNTICLETTRQYIHYNITVWQVLLMFTAWYHFTQSHPQQHNILRYSSKVPNIFAWFSPNAEFLNKGL